MRALETKLVCAEQGEAVPLSFVNILLRAQRLKVIKQCLALGFVHLQMFPRLLYIGSFKVVDGELQFILIPHVSVFHFPARLWITCPNDVVNTVHVLKKRGDALQAVGQLGGNWVEVNAAALLEICKLRDLQTVE